MGSLQTAARITVGLVFVGMGGPKFVPGMSPAADVVMRMAEETTYGLVGGTAAMVLTGALECLVGLVLITGRYLGAGILVLGAGVLGNLPPLLTGFLPGGAAPPAGYLLTNLALCTVALALAVRAALGTPPHDVYDPPARTGVQV